MIPRVYWWPGATATAVVAFLLLFGIRSCRDKGQSRDAAVMAERLRADSVIHLNDSIALARTSAQLDTAIARGTQVVDRWQTVKVPVYIPPTATPHDTIASISKRLSACYQAGDSLVQSVVKIQTSCQAFRDTATRTIKDQRAAYAHLDSLYKIGKPVKRWGVGPFIGYGFSQNSKDWAIQRGFSAGVAIHYNLFSW